MAEPLPSTPLRRMLGLCYLALVVFLWTASSFIASSMFADDSYSKPYLVTYINTSFFSLNLVPFYVRHLFKTKPQLRSLARHFRGRVKQISGGRVFANNNDDDSNPKDIRYGMLRSTEALAEEEDDELGLELQHSRSFLVDDEDNDDGLVYEEENEDRPLSVRETLMLAIKFGCFGFIANWLNAITFVYTTVASSTILTSTSSVWTLLFGAWAGVERFTVAKLIGVVTSMIGIMMIALLDQNVEEQDPARGTFPWKSPAEIALGDAFALISAIIYSIYALILAKTVGNEARVNMPLFFGFVGVAACAFMWPGIIILHHTGIETFEMPSGANLWGVLIVNGLISVIADMAWAYAVLMTSPLITAVGLSLTIPLSLFGQMLFNSQYAPAWYWLGAGIVVVAFVSINLESKVEERPHGIQMLD